MKRKTVHSIGGSPTEFLRYQILKYDEVILQFTNYTTAIITPYRKTIFHRDGKVSKPFGIFQKIKSSIQKSDVIIPEIPKGSINWNYFNLEIEYPKEFYCVDISSAYAKVLLNYNLVNEALYNELTTKIPKEDRLKSVGLLGTVKSQIIYRKGQPPEIGKITSAYAKYFFFCCYVTGEVMELCRERAGKDFIYYWVDGIAVQKEKAEEIMYYIESLGFPSKIEKVTDCEKIGKAIHYKKDGVKKTLYIPQRRDVENKEAVDFLLNASEL